MEQVLRMTISTGCPVDLLDFTGSCAAFACEFDRFSRSREDGRPARLLIREVRAGSIEIDLVPCLPAVAVAVASAVAADPLSAMSAANTVSAFVKNLGGLCAWLKGDAGSPPEQADRQTLENVEEWLEPVAKDPDGAVRLLIVGDVNAPITINSRDANVCQNVSKRKRKEMSAPQSGDVREQVLLRWHQSRNSVLGRGDMAIVDAVTPKPLRVVFQDKAMKSLLLSSDENLFKRPYLADVIVDSVEGVPRLYRIVSIEPIGDE